MSRERAAENTPGFGRVKLVYAGAVFLYVATRKRMASRTTSYGLFRSFLAAAVFVIALLPGREAKAQQKTFHLDRLEVPGGPEDGVAMFRPVTEQRNIFFGQLGIGYQLRPLRTNTITDLKSVQDRSRSSVIQDQFAVYGNVGFELLDRVTF